MELSIVNTSATATEVWEAKKQTVLRKRKSQREGAPGSNTKDAKGEKTVSLRN